MTKLLVRGAHIVTMDPALGDMARADILVEDGAIAAIGPALDAAYAEVIDGADKIALQGSSMRTIACGKRCCAATCRIYGLASISPTCCRCARDSWPRTITTPLVSAASRSCPRAPD